MDWDVHRQWRMGGADGAVEGGCSTIEAGVVEALCGRGEGGSRATLVIAGPTFEPDATGDWAASEE